MTITPAAAFTAGTLAGSLIAAYITACWLMRNIPPLKELIVRDNCPHCPRG